jgi:hypothetical protein
VLATAASASLLASPSLALASPRVATPPSAPEVAAPLAPRAPTQVVVFDRQTRTTSLVSHDASGAGGASSSSRPAISADGSLVAFESDANLVAADTNGQADIYRWSRSTNQLARISVGPGGRQANGGSHAPSVSGDGATVAFTSTATNLTDDTALGGVSQVFAWQDAAGRASLASSGANGPGGGASRDAAVSEDGRVVGFTSDASNLVDGDTNGVADVYLRNLVRGVTVRASVASPGTQATGESGRPSLSANGRTVAFDSVAANLVTGDTNRARDVFVRDLPPAVQAAPNPVDFGVVALGTPGSRTVTVVSVGWTPATLATSSITGTNAGDFVVAGDGCAGQTLQAGASCTVDVLDVPLAAGPRTATLAVTSDAPDSPQLVELRGGVEPPTVRVDPAVGPPGIVVTVRGTGFPPGALVNVRWDRGLTPPLGQIVVAPDGTFAVAVLVFHNDALGPRHLLVTAAAGGPPFPDQQAPFLVVPATLKPSGAGAVAFLAPDLQLIVDRR